MTSTASECATRNFKRSPCSHTCTVTHTCATTTAVGSDTLAAAYHTRIRMPLESGPAQTIRATKRYSPVIEKRDAAPELLGIAESRVRSPASRRNHAGSHASSVLIKCDMTLPFKIVLTAVAHLRAAVVLHIAMTTVAVTAVPTVWRRQRRHWRRQIDRRRHGGEQSNENRSAVCNLVSSEGCAGRAAAAWASLGPSFICVHGTEQVCVSCRQSGVCALEAGS